MSPQIMFKQARRAPIAATSRQAVALRDVRKVYGRGDGAVVALDLEIRPVRAHRSHPARASIQRLITTTTIAVM